MTHLTTDDPDTPYWPRSFMCPDCFMVHFGRDDVEWAYCNACHAFTGRPASPDLECMGCNKRVAVVYCWRAMRRGVPYMMIDCFCAECGRIVLRVTMSPDRDLPGEDLP